jgi:hypothetical protein
MKKNVIISILAIIIIVQFSVIIYITQIKTVPQSNVELTEQSEDNTQNDNISFGKEEFWNSYLMNNPIDDYFHVELNSKTEAEVRDTKEAYEKTWEQEYNRVMEIIDKKCVFDKDRENINTFKESIKKLIKTATPVLETEILDNYNYDPASVEERGWGNSTYYALLGIKGQIYRDACMLLIPYLEEDYQFPDIVSKN